MQVYLTVIGIVIAFLFIAFLLGIRDERTAKRMLLDEIRRWYGREPIMPIANQRKKIIPKYFENHKNSFFIDDITWNDLNLDAVYDRINYCRSGAGQEYLYYLLRCPKQDDDFSSFEKDIKTFQENARLREDCQVLFAQMKDTNRFSLYDYLKKIDDAPKLNKMSHIIPDILLLISMLLCFVNFNIFFIVLLCVVFYQVIRYFQIKAEISTYLNIFAYVIKLIDVSNRLCDLQDAEVLEDVSTLKSCNDKMESFKSGSFILVSPTRLSNTGNPISIILDYFCMITHLDIIKFISMQKDISENISTVDEMVTGLGSIESRLSIALYRASLKGAYCVPTFKVESVLKAIDLYHPNVKNAVANSLETDKGILITGSNASGKSTFLKTVAINALFAQSIHTVLAKEYSAPLYRIYSSMALRDDLSFGESYYIVEIKSLKRIIDAAKASGNTVLCFIDEVLRGTNTTERIAASTQILKSLSHENITCFAATHDIELSYLLDDYKNFHFEGLIEEDDVSFDYKFKEGPAKNRNAISLLSKMNYDEDIVEKARKMADYFDETGTWKADL